ncbi:MAG TPA: DUF4214 domain-containing protein, partial [Ramlibacter sp.]|nr:DUF4214 domain-containing protein [Ramlibacter sp.]
LAYWIKELQSGATLESIADRFHAAGMTFGVYEAGMSNEAYVAAVYDHLLARGPGHAQQPTSSEIAWWANRLEHGGLTRAGMVLEMLEAVHTTYADDPDYGWVGDLLANKAALANYYAVEQGLGRLTSQEDIAFGRQLADLVTPEGFDAAIALIGLGDAAAG